MFKILLLVALLPGMALAQTQTQTLQDPPDVYEAPATSTSRDPPPGFPYNTGLVGTTGNVDLPDIVSAQVPLRDFLSSRQDQHYTELSRQIDSLAKHLQQIIDERDRQYAQRFAAQQDATEAALAAAQDAVEAALASAEAATIKAENAANDRFESVNEFRATLADQANSFMNKSTAEARFSALDEKVDDLFIRVNTVQAQRQGGAETWGWVFAAAGVVMLVIAFLYNARSRGVRIDA